MPWNVAFAQTACPQGVAAGSAQCGPSSLVNPGILITALRHQPYRRKNGPIAGGRSPAMGMVLRELPRIFPASERPRRAQFPSARSAEEENAKYGVLL